MSDEGDGPRSLSELEAAYSDLKALIEHPGWERFRRLQEAQVRVREFEFHKPLVTLEAGLADNFLRGEISGMTTLCALAEAMPALYLRDINILREKELSDGSSDRTSSADDAKRTAAFRADRFSADPFGTR